MRDFSQKTLNEREQSRLFDEWLDQYQGLLFKVVRAYAFTPHDHDDLFQEIAVQVWKSIPNFNGDSAVSTWIYRVALYTAIGWTRKEKKHRRNNRPLSGYEQALTSSIQPQNDRLAWLYEQIAQFNKIDRSLILLLLDGFSYREIAAILGISESNVGVKIYRIKKRLGEKSQEDLYHGI